MIPELEPNADDYHLPKHRWSAFFQTYLDLALRARKIDTVIISGGSTDVGVHRRSSPAETWITI